MEGNFNLNSLVKVKWDSWYKVRNTEVQEATMRVNCQRSGWQGLTWGCAMRYQRCTPTWAMGWTVITWISTWSNGSYWIEGAWEILGILRCLRSLILQSLRGGSLISCQVEIALWMHA